MLGSSIPTHTAQKQLKALIDSTSKDKQALESAFSLEPVTKEFYKEIVGIFIKLIDSIQLPLESQAIQPHSSLQGEAEAIHNQKVDSSD
ncbi:hypothetical protein, partial [Helicobacter sp.]|uniref:hypothetical protein n=1 Tax=Helicobacter sp. TaxID=218 RepID=UPI0025BCC61C